MDRTLANVLLAVIVFGSGTFVLSLGLWLRHVGRRALRPGELERLEGQLRDLQQSVDAIAVEVERMSEGQRFMTKLLSERAEAGAPPARVPARSTT